ncbi:MAG: hypothetical protein ACFCUX_01275 [Candidatus Methylacidiphilales bacterium]
MESKGYIALTSAPLEKRAVTEIIEGWTAQYPRVEQVCPGAQAGTLTVLIHQPEDILWDQHLQFRVLSGEEFTWIYITLGHRIIETSGLSYEANTLPLDVLLDCAGIEEVIDQSNERRLDELEKAGLL